MPVDDGSAGIDKESPEGADAAGGRVVSDEGDITVPAGVGIVVFGKATATCGDEGEGEPGQCEDDCTAAAVVMSTSCSPPPTGVSDLSALSVSTIILASSLFICGGYAAESPVM